MKSSKRVRKVVKWALWVLASLVALLTIAISVAMYFVFTPERLTPMVEKLANEYVTTDVKIKGVELTFFSSFPDFSISIDTLEIAHQSDSIPPLLYTEYCMASLKAKALLKGDLIVNEVTLRGAKVNLYVDSLIGPLKVFKLPIDTTEVDTLSLSDPYMIALRDVKMESSSVTIDDRRQGFYSRLDSIDMELSARISDRKVGMDVVLALPDIFVEHYGERYADHESLKMSVRANYVYDSLKLNIARADVQLNAIDFSANGTLEADSTFERFFVDIFSTLKSPSLSEFTRLIPSSLMPSSEPLHTDGMVDMAFSVKGEYSEDFLPIIEAEITAEDLRARYASRKVSIDDIDCRADVVVDFNDSRNSYAEVENFRFRSSGIVDIGLSGRVTDILDDPLFDVKLSTDVNFNRFSELFPLDEAITLQGTNKSDLEVKLLLSDILDSNYAKFYVSGESTFSDMVVYVAAEAFAEDSTSTGALFMDVEKGSFLFGENVRKDNDSRTLLSTVSLAGVGLKDQDGQFVVLSDVNMVAGANFDNLSKEINGVGVSMAVNGIALGVEEQLDIMLDSTTVKFTYSPKTLEREPHITGLFTTKNAFAYEVEGNSEVKLSGGQMEFDLLKTGRRKWTSKGELSFSNFDLASDLFPLDIAIVRSKISVEENNIKLSNTRVKMGESAIVATGNVQNLFRVLFAPNQNQNQQQGQKQKQKQNRKKKQEQVKLQGSLTLRSRSLNLTELLDAVSQSVLLSDSTTTEEVEVTPQSARTRPEVAQQRPKKNEGFRGDSSLRVNRAVRDTTHRRHQMPPPAESSIFLVPKNIDFDLKLNLAHIIYEGGSIDSLKGNAKITDGVVTLEKLTLQAIGAHATSSMTYSNVDRRNSRLLLDLSLKEVDINRIGELLPSVDTLMPMIRSFEGRVDFDVRAAGLMNDRDGLSMATLRAAIDMQGRDLVLMDSETFTLLSKKLLFKNKDRNLIDSLAVSVIADSSKVDVLPFTIGIDRYSAIVGGSQVIDDDYNVSYDYNVSIIKSPLPFKAGVDIIGDLEDYNFDITRAKLKHTDFVEQRRLFEEFAGSIE